MRRKIEQKTSRHLSYESKYVKAKLFEHNLDLIGLDNIKNNDKELYDLELSSRKIENESGIKPELFGKVEIEQIPSVFIPNVEKLKQKHVVIGLWKKRLSSEKNYFVCYRQYKIMNPLFQAKKGEGNHQ